MKSLLNGLKVKPCGCIYLMICWSICWDYYEQIFDCGKELEK